MDSPGPVNWASEITMQKAQAAAAEAHLHEQIDNIKKLARSRCTALVAIRACQDFKAFVDTTPGSVAQLIAADGHVALLTLLRQYRDRQGAAVAILGCILAACRSGLRPAEEQRKTGPVRSWLSIADAGPTVWPRDFVGAASRAVADVLQLYPASENIAARGCRILELLYNGGDVGSRTAMANAGIRDAVVGAQKKHGARFDQVSLSCFSVLAPLSTPSSAQPWACLPK